jgi:LCP family protein required for cell wall assembly
MVWVLGGGFAVMALFSAALVFRTVRGIAAAWTGVGLPDIFTSQSDAEPATSGQPDGPQPTPDLSGVSSSWNGVDRINILMMGLDYRDWLSGEGPPRTDSMMLVTIDPITKSAGMLSIPRDLWVEVPGFEHNRINTAYFLGETYRLPGGGPGLAMQTVENLIGVPVPYYAVIEFSAFERFIDEIGGVEVLVPERMKISPLGRDSIWLEPKGYRLDGPEALAYARARKTDGGDFDRAERQQQVLMAVRDQVLELDMVATLLGRAPALYQDLRQGIQTNLTLDQLVALGLLAAQVDLQDISKGVIAPPEMVLLDTHLDGAMVLKPVPDQIRALRDAIFTGTGAIAPSVPPETSAEAVQIEHARLAVLNGAGLEGLATDTAEYLQGQGLNVIQIDNADRIDYDKSRVIVYSQNYPYTIRYLAELLGLTEGQILQAVFPESDLDLMVILGADWAYGTRP